MAFHTPTQNCTSSKIFYLASNAHVPINVFIMYNCLLSIGTSSKIIIFASKAHVSIDEFALSHTTEVRKRTHSIENTFYREPEPCGGKDLGLEGPE